MADPTDVNAYSTLMSLYKGMDGGRDASTLDGNTFAKGINVSTRGGFVRTRPGFVREAASFKTGIFQGAAVWSLDGSDMIIGVTSGYVWLYNLNNRTMTDVGLWRHPVNTCYFEQVDRYMVIQDGNIDGYDPRARPLILDFRGGQPVIYAYEDPHDTYKMPTGTIMKYVHGRLHLRPVTVPNTTDDGRPYFLSGDILLPSDPQSALRFEETMYLSGGGAHALPSEMGFVSGMSAFRNSATGTGYGSLLVFGRNGVSAFDMSLARSSWTTQQLSSVLFFGAGTMSPWSIVMANDDVLYRSQDGLRSIRYTQAMTASQSSLSLANVPLSNEVKEYMQNEVSAALSLVSASFADNRFLMTAVGSSVPRQFKALISLDWANMYTLSELSKPAYDGIWTGLPFVRVLSAMQDGRPFNFIVAKDSAIYRVDESVYSDYAPPKYVPNEDIDLPPVAVPQEKLIESRVVTGYLAPSTSSDSSDYVNQKKLKWLELRVSELRRSTTFKVYFRPKGYSLWNQIGAEQTIVVPPGSLPQGRRKLRFAVTEAFTQCDPATKTLVFSGVEFQFAIQWTGYCQLDTIRVLTTIEGERPPEPCSEVEGAVVQPSASAGVELSDFEYEIVE